MLKDNIPQFIGNEPQINDLLTAIQPEIDSLRQELEIDEKQLYAITTDSQVKPKDVFNREAFTVVGSPNITDDGIASGFSGNDYLKLREIELSNNFIIDCEKVKLGDDNNTSRSILNGETLETAFNIGVYQNHPYCSSNGKHFPQIIINEITLTPNQNLYLRGGVIGNTAFFEASLDGIEWKRKETAITAPFVSIRPVIGTNLISKVAWQGSIDLKQFSISVDGREVFNKDAFEVVGSPTITDDGIARGFDNSNGIQVPIINFPKANKWEIDTCFTTGSLENVSTNNTIFAGAYNKNVLTENLFTINGSKYLVGAIGNSSLNGWQASAGNFHGTTPISPNKKYWTKFIFSGTNYKLYLSENGIDFNLETTFYSSLKIGYAEGLYFQLGRHRNGNDSGDLFDGSIDLKQFSVSVDGKEVFKGTKYVEPQEFKGTKEVWQSEYMQRWERDYGLPMNLSLTIEERRNRLLSKIRRKTVLNKAGLKALIKATVNDAQFHISNKPHQYKFTVYLSDIAQKEKLHTTLYYARPAHLIYDIIELIDVRRCGTFNCGSNPL